MKKIKNGLINLARGNEITRNLFLNFSLWLNHFSYSLIKVFVTPPSGVHPKHAIMNYHQFFIDHIKEDDTILDIGCGNGLLADDLAAKAKKVIGIDIAEKNIRLAESKFTRPNLEFVVGDCLSYDFSRLGVEKFSVVVLSNVLEHLDRRIEFLKKLQQLSDKMLVRVPLLTRDWLTVYRQERGYPYKLSADHKIEYTEKILNEELAAADWKITNAVIQFGEIWAVANKKN
ncbi:MAG TPA: class I SAM-dependent methyltransferase [Candidatus Methylomirabilis sp.]|nr:class I SAM-dependent methyltransferase [Candidatus Methylomirabilis sp.]